jgi:hypothetical protein
MPENVRPSDTDDAALSAHAPWPRWSSELHESLTSHEARAAELRQELDQLRRSLDAGPVRPALEAGRSRRRRLLPAVGVVLALGCGGLIAGLARSGGPVTAATGTPATPYVPAAAPTPFPTASAVASATGGPSTAASTSASPPGSASASAPPLPAWPGRTVPEPPGLPTSGPGADAAGTEVTAMIDPDGRGVEVYERAVLTSGPGRLTLRPAGSGQLARSLETAQPAVQGLRVEVDGTPVPAVPTGTGWTVVLPARSTPHHMALRYRLTGAIVRRDPAPAGRYTLMLTPLAPAAGAGAADAVVVRIRDSRIQEMACPDANADGQLCGSAQGDLHVATVPRGALPVVTALVTFAQ